MIFLLGPPSINKHAAASRQVFFEFNAHDVQAIGRFLNDRKFEPPAAILDGRTLQLKLESGDRAGYDGAKKKKGSKIHAAVDTLGNLLVLKTTPANE
jgi:hypothetical protein